MISEITPSHPLSEPSEIGTIGTDSQENSSNFLDTWPRRLLALSPLLITTACNSENVVGAIGVGAIILLLAIAMGPLNTKVK